MKKLLSIVCAIVCAVGISFGLVSCKDKQAKELEFNKNHSYDGVSFKTAKNITLADISSFLPAGYAGYDITSVGDFKDFLKENIDVYSIMRQTESGTERIYLRTPISVVKITEGNPYVANAYSLWLTYIDDVDAQPYCYPVKRDKDTFVSADSLASIPKFYYQNGALHYDFALNEKFTIVYNYRIK